MIIRNFCTERDYRLFDEPERNIEAFANVISDYINCEHDFAEDLCECITGADKKKLEEFIRMYFHQEIRDVEE